MLYKADGYHPDGSLCVYGYNDKGAKVAIFRGFQNHRRNTVTLYPKVCLAPTSEDVGKKVISTCLLK